MGEEFVQRLVPSQRVRPQGGGTRERDAPTVFAAVVLVFTTGGAWRHLPPVFEVSPATVPRRFAAWTKPGAVAAAAPSRSRQAGCRRAGRPATGDLRQRQRVGEKGGPLTGANPVDQDKPSSKIYVLSDRAGLPFAVAVSAAHTHDSQALPPLVKAVPAIRSRRGPPRRRPAKLHADTGYDYDHLR